MVKRALPTKIAVIGAGSWGTAIADLLAKAGRDVIIWARDGGIVADINSRRRNPRYLTDVILAAGLKATTAIEEAVAGARLVVVAVPSQAMRDVMTVVARSLSKGCPVVSLTKGLETGTLLRMSQVIEETAPAAEVGVLSGPNHAEEVSRDIPSATVVTAREPGLAAVLQETFMTPTFRVYVNRDIVGVELAAAAKNVIAVAVGIADGLGYGDNAKAALMTRGLAEITRLGTEMGAKPATFAGLAGIGDLIATCTSRHSRNRAVGERLAEGRSAAEAQAELGMVAEGVRTAAAVTALAAKFNLDLPISSAVYDVIYRGKDPRHCVSELMSRGPAEEEPV